MSQEAPLSGKAKKAQRDADRHQKGKKRKRAEVDNDNAGADATKFDDVASEEKQETPSKKSRKRKADGDVAAEDEEPAEAKSKKRKKRQQDPAGTEDTADTAPQKPSKSRFIVFVGNLPYKTTDDSLQTHFKKLQPFTLRHRVDPQTKKSKGFAFLEFENYDRMKTCLKLYHHSMFDPADPEKVEDDGAEKELAPSEIRKREKKGARRINVELTAGGGGKTEGRKAKIKVKNERLEEQRKRRAEVERKERAKKEKKGGKAKAGDAAPADGGTAEVADSGMHPSRLARMKA